MGYRKDIRVAEVHENRRRLFGTVWRQPGHIGSVPTPNDAGRKVYVGVWYNVTEVSRNGVDRRLIVRVAEMHERRRRLGGTVLLTTRLY